MKLSDAILLGSTMKPQGFGALFGARAYEGAVVVVSSCALGSALDAIGDQAAYPEGIWPWLTPARLCPECKLLCSPGAYAITHLNDTHRWTREQIAAFIATIEPSETPNVPSEAPAELVCAEAK